MSSKRTRTSTRVKGSSDDAMTSRIPAVRPSKGTMINNPKFRLATSSYSANFGNICGLHINNGVFLLCTPLPDGVKSAHALHFNRGGRNLPNSIQDSHMHACSKSHAVEVVCTSFTHSTKSFPFPSRKLQTNVVDNLTD